MKQHTSAVSQAAGTPALSAAAAASLPASVLASAAASDGRTTLSSGDGDGVPDAARRITHYLPPDLVPDVWRGESFRLYPWQVGNFTISTPRSSCPRDVSYSHTLGSKPLPTGF